MALARGGAGAAAGTGAGGGGRMGIAGSAPDFQALNISFKVLKRWRTCSQSRILDAVVATVPCSEVRKPSHAFILTL